MNKLFLIFLIGLFSVSAFSATKTWNGNGANNNWQTAANWVGGVAPVANDDLIFPVTAAQFSTNNNFFNGIITYNSITFDGNYTINGNPLRIGNNLTVNSGTQTINIPIEINGGQTLNGALGTVTTIAALSISGSDTHIIDGAGSFGIGVLFGSGPIFKRGVGSTLIVASSNYIGGITIAEGIFIVDANMPNATISISSPTTTGGTFGFSGLGGTGTVGRVIIAQGAISAGTLTSPTGIFNTGTLIFGEDGIFAAKIGGTTPGANGYDQLNVSGTVNLNNARLTLIPWNGFRSALGDSFTILKNDGTDSINGTFLNAPENSVFSGALNTAFRITYQGGDGNDVVATRVNKAQFDFDSDGKTDISVFRNGNWYKNLSSNGNFEATAFGLTTDKITPADFDGDNKTDIAVYRPSNGTWYILRSSDSTFNAVQFGAAEDIPVPNDFDGDGRADIAVFRPSNGSWYQLSSLTNQFSGQQFGTNGDKPLVGDFDGDGIGDLAVFRPSNGVWYSMRSADNSFIGISFGLADDIPVPADYDGDGKTDISVFRKGSNAGSQANFYVLRSSDSGFQAAQFGTFGDIPVAGDYDGDGRADYAVFRPSAGNWYILGTTSGFSGFNFGLNGDKPIPAAFLQ